MILHENDPNKVAEIIKNNEFVIVDFWAEWCGPCVELGKELHKLDAKFEKDGKKMVIVKMNVDESNMDAVSDVLSTLEGSASDAKPVETAFDNGAVPILIFFKNGVIVNKNVDPSNKKWIGFYVGSMSMARVENLLVTNALI